jgi:hypothetical protein
MLLICAAVVALAASIGMFYMSWFRPQQLKEHLIKYSRSVHGPGLVDRDITFRLWALRIFSVVFTIANLVILLLTLPGLRIGD